MVQKFLVLIKGEIKGATLPCRTLTANINFSLNRLRDTGIRFYINLSYHLFVILFYFHFVFRGMPAPWLHTGA